MQLSRRTLNTLALALACTSLTGQSAPGAEPAPGTDGTWQSSLQRTHPLAGRIWHVAQKRFITPAHLIAELARTDFILLGEIHDNRDHHLIQAWITARLTAKRNYKALVMEMLSGDQSGQLEKFLARPGAAAPALGPAVDWQKRGWPDWKYYQPIAAAALKAGMGIFAGISRRQTIRAIGRKGFDTLPEGLANRFRLDLALPDALEKSLRSEIVESHCNLLPAAATGPMVNVQRFKDAVMADAMLRHADNSGAILIAGNGHVRTDRGVPWYLARRHPGIKMASVFIAEVHTGTTAPGDLVAHYPDGRIAAQFVWFTPARARKDPCEQMRRMMKKRKRGNTPPK